MPEIPPAHTNAGPAVNSKLLRQDYYFDLTFLNTSKLLLTVFFVSKIFKFVFHPKAEAFYFG